MDTEEIRKRLIEALENHVEFPKEHGHNKYLADIKKRDLLYEGLTMTYPVNKTISRIKNLGIANNKINTVLENNTPVIYISIEPDINIFNIINKNMDLYGWFFNCGIINDGNTYKNINDVIKNANDEDIKLTFTAKFDLEVSDNKPKFLYHLAPFQRAFKIQERGLSPKDNSKLANHPSRVYFLPSDSNSVIQQFIPQLFNTEDIDYDFKKKYVLFKIETFSTIPTRLFRDPDMSDALYTKQNIPPSRLTVIREYFLDDDGNVKRFINITNNKII